MHFLRIVVCAIRWQITYKIFAKKDDLTPDGFVVDKVLDKTGMKGEAGSQTGRQQPGRGTDRQTLGAYSPKKLEAQV